MQKRLRSQALLSVAIFIHVAALFLNNLPWSALVEPFYPIYSVYIIATGQSQNWTLYTNVLKSSPTFELGLGLRDGKKVLPWGSSHEMSSRQLYFIEAVLINKKLDKYADRLLQWFWEHAPQDAKPSEAHLSHFFIPIPAKGLRTLAGMQEPPTKVYQKTW